MSKQQGGMMKSPTADARNAWILALAGFLPFGAGALVLVLPESAMVRSWQAWAFMAVPIYGAVILSFLGGIRWGIALVLPGHEGWAPRQFVLSVLPSLWGWGAALMGQPVNFILLAIGFVLTGLWDRGLKQESAIPLWFVSLRMTLTILVTLALIVCAAATAWPLIKLALGA
jgi:hypothetical protein